MDVVVLEVEVFDEGIAEAVMLEDGHFSALNIAPNSERAKSILHHEGPCSIIFSTLQLNISRRKVVHSLFIKWERKSNFCKLRT